MNKRPETRPGTRLRHAVLAAFLLAPPACRPPREDPKPANKAKAAPQAEEDEEPAPPPKPKTPALEIGEKDVAGTWVAGLGNERSKRYLRLTIEATLRREASGSLKAKVVCDVGEKKMAATSTVLGINLSKMNPGETSKGHVAFWALDPLDAPPKACDITLSLGDDDFYESTMTWK